MPLNFGRPLLEPGSVLIDLQTNELKFSLNNEVISFDVFQLMMQQKDISVFSIVDSFYEDEQEVSIEERFVVETLATILMNFDSEGIKEID